MQQLTDDQIWEGAQLSIDNSEQIYQAAVQIAERGNYGAASSLMILSTEESAKFFGLISKGIADLDDRDDLKKYFTNHQYKHSSALVFFTILRIMDEVKAEVDSIDSALVFFTILRIMDEVKAEVDSIENDPDIPSVRYAEELFKHFMRKIKIQGEERKDYFSNLVEWKKTADSVKKKGFYVDWLGGSWHSPKDISQQQYQAVEEKAKYMLRMMKHISENSSLKELQDEYQGLAANK